MEEKIEGLLKEKEAAQLAMVPVTTFPIAVVGTEPSSLSTTIESTSTIVDPLKITQELAIKKKQQEKLLENFKNLEVQKINNDIVYGRNAEVP